MRSTPLRHRSTSREIAIGCAVALVIALASAGCRPETSMPDGDAATDAVQRPDGDAWTPPDGFDAGLDGASPDVVAPRWPCPMDWVPFARGGCGPAVLLCGPEGGALAGACDGIEVRRPRALDPGDGGTVTSFFVQPDGGIGGGWNAPSQRTDAGTACPEGIPSRPDGTCGAVLREDCPAGSGALPDGTCTATDDSVCPAGPFADPGPDATGAIVVRVTADADPTIADGSVLHPFATIAAAVAHAGPGGWVLVGRGRFAEAITAGHDVHVLGLCAAQTTLAAAGTETTLLANAHARVDLRGLTVGGAAGAITVEAGAQLSLSNVRVLDAIGFGVLVTDSGSAIVARDVLVQGTRAVLGGAAGVGVRVRSGGYFVGQRLAYLSNHGGMVVRDPGSTANLLNVLVSDSLQRFDGTDAAGLGAFAGGRVRGHGVVISSSRGFGVVAENTGSQIDLVDSTVQGSLPLSDAAPGVGVQARMGASITLTRVVATGNRAAGVSSNGAGTSMVIADTSVTDTLPTITGVAGHGLEAVGGAALRADRTVVASATEVAVFVSTGASATLGDVLVIGTRASIQGFGLGVVVGTDAHLDAQRLAVTHVSGAGIATVRPGAALPGMGGALTARHLFVRFVHEGPVQFARSGSPLPTGSPVAYGLSSTSSSSLHASYAVIADGTIGLFDRASMLSLENAVITGQQLGVALASAAATSQPTFYDVVFLGNSADGPTVDPMLPEPFSTP